MIAVHLQMTAGTGSTGRAASSLGLGVISVDASAEAVSLAKRTPVALPLFPQGLDTNGN